MYFDKPLHPSTFMSRWTTSHVPTMLSLHHYLGAFSDPVAICCSHTVFHNNLLTQPQQQPFRETDRSFIRKFVSHSTFSPYNVYRHPAHQQADFTELLTMIKGYHTASRSISVYVSSIYTIIPYITLSVYNLFLSHIVTFHYKTWRTIVNIRFHSIYQVKLHNLETSYGSSYIELNQQLPFRVVDYHIIRTTFPCPHIQRWFDYRLSFTCSSNCKRGYQRNPPDYLSISFPSTSNTYFLDAPQ